VVADIGCGGGSFLDFVSGAAREIIAIEPSKEYDNTLKERGYHTYQYADQAKEWFGKVDVVVSFDVIEHVASPEKFMMDMKNLLTPDGIMIIGTPTDYPVLRQMLGETFDRFIFQIHHRWVLSEKSMEIMADRLNIRCDEIKTIQKYGLGNLIYWLRDKKPRGHIRVDFISDSVNDAYMDEMSREGRGEYIVFKGSRQN
jgi:2-polyprenyl-3-methyl-5-hydroxy-6-metoxy-1,4-benzoquinol methylase